MIEQIKIYQVLYVKFKIIKKWKRTKECYTSNIRDGKVRRIMQAGLRPASKKCEANSAFQPASKKCGADSAFQPADPF